MTDHAIITQNPNDLTTIESDFHELWNLLPHLPKDQIQANEQRLMRIFNHLKNAQSNAQTEIQILLGMIQDLRQQRDYATSDAQFAKQRQASLTKREIANGISIEFDMPIEDALRFIDIVMGTSTVKLDLYTKSDFEEAIKFFLGEHEEEEIALLLEAGEGE